QPNASTMKAGTYPATMSLARSSPGFAGNWRLMTAVWLMTSSVVNDNGVVHDAARPSFCRWRGLASGYGHHPDTGFLARRLVVGRGRARAQGGRAPHARGHAARHGVEGHRPFQDHFA